MGVIYRDGVAYGGISSIAGNVSYDNSTSHLQSSTVQNAITELKSIIDSKEYTSIAFVNSLPAAANAQYNTLYIVDSNNDSVFELWVIKTTLGQKAWVAVGDNSKIAALQESVAALQTEISGLSYIASASIDNATGNLVLTDSANNTVTLQLDGTPTANSKKPITSGAVYTALDDQVGKKEYVNGELQGEIFYTFTGVLKNEATGTGSHAEGIDTIASGDFSHAEGASSQATGDYGHAEGVNSRATTDGAHAEGGDTKATGINSHAEGGSTEANGTFSHSEGTDTIANGYCSHSGGIGTIANSRASTVIGKYNIADGTGDNDPKHLFIIGNGVRASERSNIVEVDSTALNVNGDIKQNGVTIEGKPIIDVNALPAGASIKNVVYRLFKDKYDGFYMIYNQVMVTANIFQKMGYPCFISSEISIDVAGTTATITLADDLVYYTESSTDYYVKTIDITNSSVVFKDKTNATLKTVTLTEANSPQIINLYYKVYELYAGDATNQTFTVIKTNNDIDDVEYSYINSEKPLAGYVVKGQVDKIHTELTQAQYDALQSPDTNTEYFITDASSGVVLSDLESRLAALEMQETVYYIDGVQRVPLYSQNITKVVKIDDNTVDWYFLEPTSQKTYKARVTAQGEGNTRTNPLIVVTEVNS